MAKWTADQIRRIAPGAHDTYVAALVDGWDAIVATGINDQLTRAHFLTQAVHETGGLKIVREATTWTTKRAAAIWPTHFGNSAIGLANTARLARCADAQAKANLVYGSLVKGLGNTEPDDGWRYRGGGFNQLTGREAYRRYGQQVGVDLEARPELIEEPSVSLAVYLQDWAPDMLSFARHNYLRAIANKINRGNAFSRYDPIGWSDRQEWFKHVWSILGEGQLPDPTVLYLGAFGSTVQDVQARLHELGYSCGAVDGVYGPVMARVVAGFKADQARAGASLEPGDCIGQITRAALESADRISHPERSQVTVQDLAEAGSTEVKAGLGHQTIGTTMTVVGGVAAAMDGLDSSAPTAALHAPFSVEVVSSHLQWIPAMHGALVPVVEALDFFRAHFISGALVAGGAFMYLKGWHIIEARLQAHRSGANLSK